MYFNQVITATNKKMNSTVIKAEDIGKQYRLGTVGTGSLAHDINRAWHKLRGKEDPYLQIGDENNRSQHGLSDYVWALRNINFEVSHGEVVGIIGRNGAGKSTLLKILSRTTSPTTGIIKIKGRVASLLEVGTGFHPELTGRENIFLNGAILGMTKKEINKKFDDIVDFAGVERYVDTPVKRYSSGMYVRLAFAVAAHLEPEILIVDEVLAVGDAEFQKKALGKMKDVSGREGRTVLFVSHNMGVIQQICSKAILLKNGLIASEGKVAKVIEDYVLSSRAAAGGYTNRFGNKRAVFESFELTNENGEALSEFFMGENILVNLTVKFNEDISGMELGMNIKNSFHDLISHVTSFDEGLVLKGKAGETRHFKIMLREVFYSPSMYFLDIALLTANDHLDMLEDALSFTLMEGHKIKRGVFPQHVKVFTNSEWTIS